ncbi:MAG TPA: hypothetical protein VGM96_14450 [Reyranella sp.]|jgi:hypothetical protein
MKTGIMGAALTFGLLSASALAQGADDASDKLRVCSLMEQAERLICLNKLAEEIRPPAASAAMPSAPGAPASDNWIVGETTSPVDYSPVVVATTSSSGGADGNALKLAIQCRGGRTDLVFVSPSLTRRSEDYALSYVIADGSPVKVAVAKPASGTGVAVKGDVVRLLTSLPDRGEIAVRIAAPDGSAVEGRYSLESLKGVRHRLAAPCRWPAAAGAPHN